MSITIAGFSLILYIIVLAFKGQLNFESLFVTTLFCELYLEIGYAFQIGGYINYRTLMEFLLFSYVVYKLKYIPSKLLIQSSILYVSFLLSFLLLMLFPSNQLVAVIDTSWDEILVGAKRKNPEVNGYVIQMLIQFFIYIVVYVYIVTNFRKKDYLGLLCKVNQLINIMLIFGLVEFIVVSILQQGSIWGDLKTTIFGSSESTITIGRARGNLYELCLFTKEASHYAVLLFLTFFIKMAYNKSKHRSVLLFSQSLFPDNEVDRNRSRLCEMTNETTYKSTVLYRAIVIELLRNKYKKKAAFDFFLCLNIFLLAVCMSFTSLLCGLGIIGVLLIYRWYVLKPSSMKIEKGMVFVASCGFLLIFSTIVNNLNDEGFFSRRLLSVMEEIDVVTSDRWMVETDALEWSNRVRLLSVYQTMKTFLYRPIFGYGIGAVTAHGATPMFLAGAGIVGVYLWAQFNFFQNRLLRLFYSEKKGIRISVFFFFLVFMLGGFLRNFYEVSAILLAISFCIIFSKRKLL